MAGWQYCTASRANVSQRVDVPALRLREMKRRKNVGLLNYFKHYFSSPFHPWQRRDSEAAE